MYQNNLEKEGQMLENTIPNFKTMKLQKSKQKGTHSRKDRHWNRREYSELVCDKGIKNLNGNELSFQKMV